MALNGLLPINAAEMRERGWQYVDFVVVTGDAYVDHPSFGAAIIARVLEHMGFNVGVLSQPNFNTAESFKVFGQPRYGFFITGGNVDSMVAHYSVAKKRRSEDEYTPGGKAGARPDRAVTVYSKLAKLAYAQTPVIIGGLEASLRRFSHYDYWADDVLQSVLVSSGADLLCYGMAELQTRLIAARLRAGEAVGQITAIDGTCFLATFENLPKKYIECAGHQNVAKDKLAYAKACKLQMDNQDHISGKALVQKQTDTLFLVQNKPMRPLTQQEFDDVYELPYTRGYHPSYDARGGVAAIEEVEFSLIQNRGCFGGCNFCAITLHQGRRISARSEQSLLKEAQLLTDAPNFKGYIHDVGGPTANFRRVSCTMQTNNGMCTHRKCLAPTPCPKLEVDHSEYLHILRSLRALPKVKKVFVRSGLRYDYIMADKDDSFLKELVAHHVSGQLKVAPEHCAPITLAAMGKPGIDVYNGFAKKFYDITAKAGKKQYLVPYIMSSHPGCTLQDAVKLAEYLYKNNIRPEQVQDFYPTPGTVSTCMYHTGLDPNTLKPIQTVKTAGEKAMQRALLQYFNPKNEQLVRAALIEAKRQDLIPLLLKGAKNVQKKEVVLMGQAAPDERSTRGRPKKARPNGKSKRKIR